MTKTAGATAVTDIVDAYPLTRMQGGMLFHSELAAGDALYQNVDSLRVRARFDPELMRRALTALVERHPVLRTSFDLTGYAEPVQLVHRTVELPLEVHDLRPAPAGAGERFEAWMVTEASRGFDWARAPLLRFTIHHLGEREFRLSVSSHHAILDGWSINTLLAEVLDHYRHLLADPTSPGPRAPRTGLADLVAVERAALAATEPADWWRERMAEATPTRLPRWPDRAPRAGHRVPAREAPLPPDLSAGLHRLAAEAGVPVKTVLLAAHLVVLRALGGQADVTTGLVSNGRPDTEDAQDALGLFLNTLPFRLRLTGGSCRELVTAVFQAESEVIGHRHYPLLDLQRACGGGDLFETTFNFVNFHALDRLADDDDLILDGWQHFQQTSIPFAATFGIGGVALGGTPGEIRMLIAYDADEFEPAQVDDIEARYLTTLATMVSDPDVDYRGPNLMGADEWHRVVRDCNDTDADHPVDLIHRLFEAQVDRTPDAPAIRFQDQTTTYSELDRRANRIAGRLRALGIGPEDRVAIAVDRSVAMVAAVLGALKAGAAYVPLDLTNPAGRLAFLLEDSAAAAVLAGGPAVDRVPAGDRPVLVVDDPAEPAYGLADDARPDAGATPDNAAYVIYTSGSTGRPKGVVLAHRSVANFTTSTRKLFTVDSRDRILQYASLSFDVSVFELFTALHCGATLVVIPQDTVLSLNDLADAMRRERVTVMDMPPAVMALLPATSFPDLRAAFVGGEEFSADLVNRWALPGRTFVNGYGPTEACVTVTVKDCAGWHDRRPSIGNPLPNHQAYVVDADLHPTSVGVAGELCIGGAGLARGYLDRAGLTADRFAPDPFATRPGARMYRTGDLAVRQPDGELGFLGRIDDQVKLRGLRIELGEVSAVLDSHPAVDQSVAVVRPGPGGGQRLVAYVAGHGIDPEALRAFLADRIPRYAVPERFVELERLPVTTSGKVDRDALPEPGNEHREAADRYLPARDDLELVLCQLWSEVLEVERIGVRDDFFQSGGNSLLATQLVARVREMFGVRVDLRALFDEPTVEAAARSLRQDPDRRADLDTMAGILAGLCRDGDGSDEGGDPTVEPSAATTGVPR